MDKKHYTIRQARISNPYLRHCHSVRPQVDDNLSRRRRENAESRAIRLYDILRNTPKQVNMDPFHHREAGEHQEDMSSEPEGVTYEDAPAVDGPEADAAVGMIGAWIQSRTHA